MKTTTTVTTDYSTLGRLRKNINELDSLIYSLEANQKPVEASNKTIEVKETTVPVKVKKEAPPPAAAPVSPKSPKGSILKTTKTEEVKIEPMETVVSLALASAKDSTITTTTTTTKRTTESCSGETPQPKVPRGEGSKWTLCGVPVWPLLPSFHASFLFFPVVQRVLASPGRSYPAEHQPSSLYIKGELRP